jgi:Na+/H+ antiporter NhaC
VSAFTQGATLKDVVRSRFPLAMTAAIITGIVLFVAGDTDSAAQQGELAFDTDPQSMFMLAGLAVVVISALLGRHLIESMVYGIISSVAIGVAVGNLKLSQLIHMPAFRGESTGLIQDGLGATQNAIIFVLLLLAVTQVVIDSGIMRKFLALIERSFIKTVRQCEMAIIGLSIVISIPISSNASAELLVGPSLVKPLGEKFDLAPARRANLMDCGVCSVFYMLPWHIGVMVWHAAIVGAADEYSISAPSIGVAFLNPYSWAILGVILFSAYTGWNRRFENGPDPVRS